MKNNIENQATDGEQKNRNIIKFGTPDVHASASISVGKFCPISQPGRLTAYLQHLIFGANCK